MRIAIVATAALTMGVGSAFAADMPVRRPLPPPVQSAFSWNGFYLGANAGGLAVDIRNNETRSGWTVGGGIEVAFTQNWSAKVEYLYMDFGNRDQTLL